jgi:hypothetical protein
MYKVKLSACFYIYIDTHGITGAAMAQGGKGRTGVFISAFLLWSHHRRTALDALELFTFRRTQNYDPEARRKYSVTNICP